MKSKLKKELVIPPKRPNQDLPCDFEPLSHPLGLGRLTNKVLIQCNAMVMIRALHMAKLEKHDAHIMLTIWASNNSNNSYTMLHMLIQCLLCFHMRDHNKDSDYTTIDLLPLILY